MPIEVEMKFPVAEWHTLERHLHELQGSVTEGHQEHDAYFNAPDRDFAETDEALRVRRRGLETFVTYKGPKQDADTKTRREIEVPLQVGEEPAACFVELLGCLGFRLAGNVYKVRRQCRLTWKGFALEVSLDEVQNLGDFVELEIVVDEDRVGGAISALKQIAESFGLENPERRSYLELLLAKP